MKHTLKIWPQYYARVADGSKTFEIRENDRAFQSGDIVVLREWNPDAENATTDSEKGFTGSPDLEFKIGYIHYDSLYSAKKVVFSLLPIKSKK